jgi:2-phosphosulfolactate phosphatase
MEPILASAFDRANIACRTPRTPQNDKRLAAAKIELHHKVHVLTRKEELDSVRVPGKVVVIIDVLFATTTMVAALAHGAREIIPVLDEAAARAEDLRRGAGSCVLAGELYAETLPGFAHPAPLALIEHGIKDRTVVYSTTNGTVAMALATGARRVYCGALINATRLVEHITREHAGETVLLVCAGSGGNFNFEDFYGAGCLVERFAERLGPAGDLSDAARAARTVSRNSPLPQALLECRLGRMMSARGLRHEVEFSCRIDAFPVVPVLEDGRLRLV